MESSRAVILVVEDEPTTADLIAELLAEAGYTVEVAPDGAAALTRLEAGGVDLVLLDLMLPYLDGIRLCRLLRAREDEVYRPIIMITALAGDATRHAGFVAGADDYLTKPFRNDELLDRVRVWVRTRQRLKAASEQAQAHPSPRIPTPTGPPAPPGPAPAPAPGEAPGHAPDPLEEAIQRHEGLLRHLVSEAMARPGFLAAVLVPYARSRGWDDAQLAAAIGCPLATLPRLLLCRRPLPMTWDTDVTSAARACGADPVALAAALRAAGAGDSRP